MPKQLKNEIKFVLCKVINQSIQYGEKSKALKLAKVSAVHKSGDKLHLNNYRPVSVLPIFSKIFEKVTSCAVIDLISKAKKILIIKTNAQWCRLTYERHLIL